MDISRPRCGLDTILSNKNGQRDKQSSVIVQVKMRVMPQRMLLIVTAHHFCVFCLSDVGGKEVVRGKEIDWIKCLFCEYIIDSDCHLGEKQKLCRFVFLSLTVVKITQSLFFYFSSTFFSFCSICACLAQTIKKSIFCFQLLIVIIHVRRFLQQQYKPNNANKLYDVH